MISRPTLLLLAVTLAACSKPAEPPPPASAPPPAASAPQGELPPELAEYRKDIEASRLDYARAHARRQEYTALWASKLRGRPYMPKGASWPRDPSGQPLALLAQINFSDLPQLPGYPDKGIVQFYIHGGSTREHVWGMATYAGKPKWDPRQYFASLQDQRFFRVVYHRTVVRDDAQLQAEVPRLPADWVLPVNAEAELTFKRESEPVLVTDYRWGRVFGTDVFTFFGRFGAREVEIAQAYERHSYRHAVAKVGGYGLFVQGDPRASVPNEDWLVLLGIQSSNAADGVEVMWGDVGVANFLIRRDDLARRDFSKVAYYWDNH